MSVATVSAETFTTTERRMLDRLSDGQPHRREDLCALLPDDQGDFSNVQRHLSNIRKKLPAGEAIICEYRTRAIWYRWIVLKTPAGRPTSDLT